MHLHIIWLERIFLLQVYFSHFIAKQGTMFKDVCFKQCTQFYSTWSCSALIYYEPAHWSFRRHIPCANHFVIVIYKEVFLYFYPNQFYQKIVFFCVLAEENHNAFSERLSLISGVLQGLVKICKKYMEVNHFLLPHILIL